jgi:superfamily II DNA or RNA helicase
VGQPSLRPWQREALSAYAAAHVGGARRDFLVTATPGAGKTTFALAVAVELMGRRVIDRVVVVCPTDHLRTQWADAAAAFGLVLDPKMANAQGPVPAGCQGYVATYAQVAARPAIHRARSGRLRSLVVLDEIHHAGDGLSWGEAVGEAFGEVHRRLSLTGTPFRTKAGERIPFVEYETDGDLLRSVADYTYGYRRGLADRVVRPVVFAAYSGVSRWRNSAGDVIAASLTEAGTKSVETAAWRTALDPTGGWVPHVIAAMDERISQLRTSGMPDAAGLVLASDQDDARDYAEVVRRITGKRPVLILSDDAAASRRIEKFRGSDERIAVCVRMISEGVDIPRAACLAWLTSYRTPLFFAQAIGRVVRARGPHEVATVFLPAVRPLLSLAAELEQDRNHVMAPPPPVDDDLAALADPLPREPVEPGGRSIEVLGSEAEFPHVLHSGRAVVSADSGVGPVGSGTRTSFGEATASAVAISDDDQDYLGLPGLLSPEQTAALLATRDSDLRRRVRSMPKDPPAAGSDRAGSDAASVVGWRAAADLRREVNQLVARVAARTGKPHAAVHSQVRRAVPGPASAAADPGLLTARRDHLLGLL